MITKDSNATDLYGVFRKGGTLSDIEKHSIRIDGKPATPIDVFDNKDDAQALAKRRNAELTPGEKNYFGIAYTWKKLTSKELELLSDFIAGCEDDTTSIIPAELQNEFNSAKGKCDVSMTDNKDGDCDVAIKLNTGSIVNLTNVDKTNWENGEHDLQAVIGKVARHFSSQTNNDLQKELDKAESVVNVNIDAENNDGTLDVTVLFDTDLRVTLQHVDDNAIWHANDTEAYDTLAIKQEIAKSLLDAAVEEVAINAKQPKDAVQNLIDAYRETQSPVFIQVIDSSKLPSKQKELLKAAIFTGVSKTDKFDLETLLDISKTINNKLAKACEALA